MSPLCLPVTGEGLHHAHCVPTSRLMLLPSSVLHAGCGLPVSSSQFPVRVSTERGSEGPTVLCCIPFHASQDALGHSHRQLSIFVWGQGKHFWVALRDQGSCVGHGRAMCFSENISGHQPPPVTWNKLLVRLASFLICSSSNNYCLLCLYQNF